jgi:hypothetical protein
MDRNFYEYSLINAPNAVPEYASFVTRNNINAIISSVKNIVWQHFPSDRSDFTISEDSIRNVMWEVYHNTRGDNKTMIQMVSNIISNYIINVKTSMDTSYLNPHIQDNPEQFGLHYSNPVHMKLNNKRNDTLYFNGP